MHSHSAILKAIFRSFDVRQDSSSGPGRPRPRALLATDARCGSGRHALSVREFVLGLYNISTQVRAARTPAA
jgi:hypothetical protein